MHRPRISVFLLLRNQIKLQIDNIYWVDAVCFPNGHRQQIRANRVRTNKFIEFKIDDWIKPKNTFSSAAPNFTIRVHRLRKKTNCTFQVHIQFAMCLRVRVCVYALPMLAVRCIQNSKRSLHFCSESFSCSCAWNSPTNWNRSKECSRYRCQCSGSSIHQHLDEGKVVCR